MTQVSLTDTYRQILTQPSDIQAHLSRFVAICENLDAQRVLELGVRTGVSTVAWLEGLRRTGGHLWAVDIEPCPIDHATLTFVRGDDCDPAVIAQIPDDLDLIFVDTSHLFLHTQKEIELYLPKLAPGGAILFHDVGVERFDHHPDDEPPFPVKKAVLEAGMELGWDIDWFDDSYGLAICWPPAEEDET